MKKSIMTVFATAAVAMLTACSSINAGTTLNNVKITDVPNATGVAHLHADIWGIYLCALPLFSGSSKQPGRCALFTDTVTVDNAVAMLTKKAAADYEATTVTDLQSERTTVPLLFMLSYKDVQVSGNVVR